MFLLETIQCLIRQRQERKKNVQLKVFTTQIGASQIFLDPIQKRALSRSVQLEAVYLEALAERVQNILANLELRRPIFPFFNLKLFDFRKIK